MYFIFSILCTLILVGEISQITCKEIDCGSVRSGDDFTFRIHVVHEGINFAEATVVVGESPFFQTELSSKIERTSSKQDGAKITVDKHMKDYCNFDMKISFPSLEDFSVSVKSNEDCPRLLSGHKGQVETKIESCMYEHLMQLPVDYNPPKLKKHVPCQALRTAIENQMNRRNLMPQIMAKIHEFVEAMQQELLIPNLELELSGRTTVMAGDGSMWNMARVQVSSSLDAIQNGQDCQLTTIITVPSVTIKWENYQITGNEDVYGENLMFDLTHITANITASVDISDFPCDTVVEKLTIDHASIDLSSENDLTDELKTAIVTALSPKKAEFLEKLSVDLTKSLRYETKRRECSF